MADYGELYYDTYSDGGEAPEEKGPVRKILGLFFKVIGVTVILAILCVFFYRFWSIREPEAALEYLWSEDAMTAAKEDPDFAVYTQELLNYQQYDETTGESSVVERSEYYVNGTDNDGNYKVSYPCYTPSAAEFQITFRYNRKVLDFLKSDLDLLALPEEYPFVFALMTADGTLVTEYEFTASTRSLYTYRRLLFHDVPASSLYYLNVYYSGGATVDLDNPYISMVVYDSNLTTTVSDVTLPKAATETEARPDYRVSTKEEES